MKNKVTKLAFVLTGVFAISSCSGGSDWNQVGTSNTINYCLLIGQVDHNDSSARTAGIRDQLGTRDTEHKRSNPNTENPIPNENFYTDSKGNKYRVVEMEHGEQKSTSGTTWDQQTANETTTLWLNKHYANTWTGLDGKKKNGQSISMFVSNNDGMAMGAIGSVRWMDGMPIFGYDANTDALQAIKDGKIFGTVDQAGTGQASAIYMVARNLIDHPEYTAEQATSIGFSIANKSPNGYVKSEFQAFNSETNAKLCNNIAVTKDNVDDFMITDPTQKLDHNEDIHTVDGQKGYEIYHSYYSSTDNFLKSTMKPLFNVLATRFAFEPTITDGNGNDEAQSINNLQTALDKGKDKYAAFILNMVKTSSTRSYLDAIYNTYKNDDGSPIKTPIIFWNRQPTDDSNKVDTQAMHDSRFKNILYIGFDAQQGGQVQGQMIVNYLKAEIERRIKL